MEADCYPSSLLQKLSSDQSTVHEALSSSPASSSVPLSRDLASRKLQAATPSAIDVLTDVMRTGDDKSRVAAASKLLSISPAIDQPQTSQSPSLPAEALASIISSLSSFAQAALPHLRCAPDLAPDLASDIPVPAPEQMTHFVRPWKRPKALSSNPIPEGAFK